MSTELSGCGAPDQSAALPADVDLEKETVIAGRVVSSTGAGAEPVADAYARLLDRRGEFVAEVVTSPAGVFRFFAAPGRWTVRVLSRHGTGHAEVAAERGVTEVTVPIG